MKRATTKNKSTKSKYNKGINHEFTMEHKLKIMLLFLFVDIVEMKAVEIQNSVSKDGGLRKGVINQIGRVKKEAKKLREITKVMPTEEQELFGEVSDAINELIELLYDKTGGYPDSIYALKNALIKHFENSNKSN